MAGAEWDFDQWNRYTVDLGKAQGSVVRNVNLLLRKTAFDIERDAKIFAPVDTGNLMNSISTTVMGLTAEIGPTASYGVFVELGTSIMAPAAFLGPAFDRHAHLFETAVGIIGERALL